MSDPKKRKKRKNRRMKVTPRFYGVVALFVVVLGLLVLLLASIMLGGTSQKTVDAQEATETEGPGLIASLFNKATPEPTPEPTPTPTLAPSPTPTPTPYFIAESNPEKYGYKGEIEVDGTIVESYVRPDPISFGKGSSYSRLPGVLTFRGNNYRDTAAYNTANLSEFGITTYATVNVGSLTKPSGKGSWSGCGWTGQPLIIKWEDDVRRNMNMYDWAKEKDGLIEVIVPAEDGTIYFMELESGKETRQKMVLRRPFKGTGTLDPRGYPLLYVGSGDQYEQEDQKSRAMIINLLTGKVIYEFGVQGRDSFAKREFYAYDAAPLIDEKTDTLIWAAENGVLYTMKLNTNFDRVNGVISVKPDHIVKLRYSSNNSYTKIDKADSNHKWLGYEGSPVVWNGFIYLASNDGLFQCVDLNTMEIKWIADTWDDTNGSPVLDVISDTEAYLYVGTSLHFTQDGNASGITPFFKINAMTGKIEGQYQKTVVTVSGVSGGIQNTAAVGKNSLSDLVYVNFARYGGKDKGVLVALHKDTMTEAWSFELDHYSWSSPTLVYTADGQGYLIQADSGGHIFLLDGRTGTLRCTFRPTDSNFEASPAIFGNYMVLGCRGDQKIFLMRLS